MSSDATQERSRNMAIVSPPGWGAHEVLELAAPDLSAHVIATVDPIVSGTTVDQLAKDYAALLERILPRYSEVSVEPVSLPDDRPAVLRVLRWTPDGGSEVTQLQMYSVEGNRACVGTATAQTSEFDRLEPELRLALESIRMDSGRNVEMPAVRGPMDGAAAPDGSAPVSVPLATSDAKEATTTAMPVGAWSEIRERFAEEERP